jgi:hypothetical protein
MCWVLSQLDIQIAFGRPGNAGDVAQPGCSQVARRLSVRERADDAGNGSTWKVNACGGAFNRLVSMPGSTVFGPRLDR